MRLYDRQGSSDGIAISQRERPPIQHHSVHETREAQETRTEVHTEFDVDRVFNPTSLRAPEPRPGYTQRWVADGTAPNADRSEQRNWFSKHQAGWAIRDPETVPKHQRHLYPSIKLANGADAIRISNQVLTEMPSAVFAQRTAAVQDVIARQASSVPDSTKELREKGRRGTKNFEIVDQSRSIRGRLAPTLADVI